MRPATAWTRHGAPTLPFILFMLVLMPSILSVSAGNASSDPVPTGADTAPWQTAPRTGSGGLTTDWTQRWGRDADGDRIDDAITDAHATWLDPTVQEAVRCITTKVHLLQRTTLQTPRPSVDPAESASTPPIDPAMERRAIVVDCLSAAGLPAEPDLLRPLVALRWTPVEDGEPRFDVFLRLDPAYVEAATSREAATGRLAEDVRSSLPIDLQAAPVTVRAFPAAEAVWVGGLTLAALHAASELPGVAAIEADRPVYPALDIATRATQAKSTTALGYGAWERFRVDGRESTIAILDTGIDDEHPAFDDGRRFAGGYDATLWLTANATASATAAARQRSTAFPSGATNPDSDDLFTHGTHVAGIAVGNDPDGRHLGFAPKARFVDVKVLARDVMIGPFGLGPSELGTEDLVAGTGSSVLEGIEYVRSHNNGTSHAGAEAPRIRIVTMSFAETEPDPNGTTVLARAVDTLTEEGIVVVAPAGNCGPEATRDQVFGPCDSIGYGTISAPGSARGAITVGNMDDNNTVDWRDDRPDGTSSLGAEYDDNSSKPELAAYGVEILAPRGDPRLGARAEHNQYQNLSGTSMAVPMVAGIVALLLDVAPDLDPSQIKEVLVKTARPLVGTLTDDVGKHDPAYGYGVVNGFHAVAVAFGRATYDDVAFVYSDLLDSRFDLHWDDACPPGHERVDDHADGGDDHAHEGPDAGDTHCQPTAEPEVNETEEPEPEPREGWQNRRPVVRFDVIPGTKVQVGEVVSFVDRSYDPDDDKLVQWVWNLGDGTSKKGQTTKHVYEHPGTYEVRLTVTDKYKTASRSGWDAVSIDVLPAPEVEESAAGGIPFMLALLGAALVAARRVRPHR